MKDLPHHMKKLNRQIVRSIRREQTENETVTENYPSSPVEKRSPREAKKIQKRAHLKERQERVPVQLTEEERNKKMKHRTPVFDRINNAKPKFAKPSSKKTPRI